MSILEEILNSSCPDNLKKDLELAIKSKSSNGKDFSDLLNRSMTLLKLSDSDLPLPLCPRVVITRWREGKDSPQPSTRKMLYQWLLKKMNRVH